MKEVAIALGHIAGVASALAELVGMVVLVVGIFRGSNEIIAYGAGATALALLGQIDRSLRQLKAERGFKS